MHTNQFEQEQAQDAEGRVRKELRSILAQVEVLGQRCREIHDFIPVSELDEKMLRGEVEPDFFHVARTAFECGERDHLEPLLEALRQVLALERLTRTAFPGKEHA